MSQTLIKSILFLGILILIAQLTVRGQDVFKLSGTLKDTQKKGLIGINIKLVGNKDTLITHSDINGNFNFKNVKSNELRFVISSLNYFSETGVYTFEKKESDVVLETIVLKEKQILLKEVIIKENPVPILLKKDTVEYNVSDYQMSKDDFLQDLLNRLPGVQLDANGNVLVDGKPMNKIRVNGKDFFSSDLKQFLDQLPANIIAKLQIIEDYGDEANFTGVKIGDPRKLLNLVIKPGMNKGKFGNWGLSYSSAGQYGINADGNYWLDDEQISANAIVSKTNALSGLINTNSASANYRNILNKVWNVFGSYDYTNNTSEVKGENIRESILNNATLFSDNNNNTHNINNNQNIKLNLEYHPNPDNYLKIISSVSLSSGEINAASNSVESGVIREIVDQNSLSALNSPDFKTALLLGHHFNKKGRVAALDISYESGKNINNIHSDNLIQYFNTNGIPIRDSLLNLLFDNQLNSKSLNVKFIYSEPINDLSNIDFVYNFNQNNQNNSVATYGFATPGSKYKIDSLSAIYATSFTTYQFDVDYRFNNKKLKVILGINFEPTILSDDVFDNNKIKNISYNFSPISNLDYVISKENTIGLKYSGESVSPSPGQLMPIANNQNLQNIIIGDPYLKPSFNQRLNLIFKHVTSKGGSLSLNLGGQFIQNKIATDIVLLPDTLNTLKQETSYLNTNGTYSINGGYYFSIPIYIFNHKVIINLNGSTSNSKDASFVNDSKTYTTNLNLLQNISVNLTLQKFVVDFSSRYSYSDNEFTSFGASNSSYKSFVFNFLTAYNLIKNLSIYVNGSKTVNIDYGSSLVSNPFILNTTLQLKLFKNQNGNIQLQAFDLFNETNNFTRFISTGTISDTRTNYTSRYFKFKFTMRLSKFGG